MLLTQIELVGAKAYKVLHSNWVDNWVCITDLLGDYAADRCSHQSSYWDYSSHCKHLLENPE